MHATTLCAAAAALALWAGPGPAQAAPCQPPPQAQAAARTIQAEVNAVRQAAGLGALSWDDRLATAAQLKACDLAAGGAFGHSGRDLRRRAKAADCRFSGPLAENLAWGYRSAAKVTQTWLASAHHRSNLLHRRVRSAGAAWMPGAGGGYWVMVYAGRCR